MKKIHEARIVALLLGATGTCAVSAGELGNIRWDGFLGAGGAVSDSATPYIERIDENGDYGDTKLGLTASANLGPEWRVAGQLISHGEGSGIVLDWAFATYQPSESFLLKAGKLKYPNSLVSEYYDVSFAQPWIRPPSEFYSDLPLGSQMTLEAMDGVAAIFSTDVGETNLYAQPFAGAAGLDDGNMKKLLGFKLGAKGDDFEAYAGLSTGQLSIESGTARDGMDGEDTSRWTVGATIDRNNMVAYTEYGQSTVDNNRLEDSAAGYVTLGYRIGQFLPNVTYSMFEQDSGSEQTALALGLRYNINSATALKVEWQNVDPTERSSAIGVGVNEMQPAGLFEELPVEGSVNILSAGLNFVF